MGANPGQAEKFHALHREFLILPNAWDPGSARMIESCGATAIARVLTVPLSVDIEGGYSADPETVGRNVAAIVDSGGVGINIEDGDDPPELLIRKMDAAREAGRRA